MEAALALAQSVLQHPEPYTIRDLFELDDESHRIELWEGSLIVSPPPGATHQRFADRLQNLLDNTAPPNVDVLTGVGIRMCADDTLFIPDIAILQPKDPDATTFEAADALVAVEVVSPGSRGKDRITKPAEYAAVGIPYYWRVELEPFPDQASGERLPVVLVHELDGGCYRLTQRLPGGTVSRIDEPFPVEFDPAALLRRPQAG